MNIVYVAADNEGEYNSSRWRCDWPARAISNFTPHKARVISLDSFNRDADLSDADVIVVQRALWGETPATIRYWRQRAVVIAEFDDAYHLIERGHVSFPFWYGGLYSDGRTTTRLTPPPIVQFEETLALCHAATTPSRLLCDDWAHILPVYHVLNYLWTDAYDAALAERERQPHPENEIWIGWGGSGMHAQSLVGSGVLTALKRICARYPQVRLALAGANTDLIDLLDIPATQIIRETWLPFEAWTRFLARFDVGLAPLCGEFDARRSHLKALEYGYMGIPFIATDAPPYQAWRRSGVLAPNEIEAWERELVALIEDPAAARDKIKTAREQAVSMTWPHRAGELAALYEMLCLSAGRQISG